MRKNTTFREVHFGLEIQVRRQVQFSKVEIPCTVQINGSHAFKFQIRARLNDQTEASKCRNDATSLRAHTTSGVFNSEKT
jgi:hypothetical protein